MKAVAYLRVSTDEQALSGAGLNGQEDACRRHADREGVDLAGPFADEGVSGAAGLEKRPGLLDALAALESGDVLLVAKRDRLGRDPLIVAMVESAVARKGCRVVSCAGEGTADDDPTNVLMRRMVDAFAEYERLIIKARTKSALAAKKRRGERVGTVPYGQSLAPDGRTLVADLRELRTIAEIRGLRAQGFTLRAIARDLTARGVPTKNGRPAWVHTTVAEILNRWPEPVADGSGAIQKESA